MSTRLNHIIKKLSVDVEFHDQTNAFELKDSLAHVCKSELLPALERTFNQKIYDGDIVKVDKIIIDLGVIDKKNWNKTFVDQVLKQLVEHFSHRSFSLANQNSYSPDNDQTTPSGRSANRRTDNVVHIAEDENIFQSILYFFRTGLLPWYSNIKSQAEWTQHLNRLLQDPDKYNYRRIMATMGDNDRALNRLVDQVPTNTLELILLLSGIGSEEIKSLLNCWRIIFENLGINELQQKRIVYRAAIHIVSETRVFSVAQLKIESTITESINECILERLRLDQKQMLCTLFNPHSTFYESALKRMRFQERKILVFIRKLVISRQEVNEKDENVNFNEKAQLKSSSDSVALSTSYNQNNLAQSKIESAKDIIEELNGDGLYVNNAGLVILHPFLLKLFENVGYLEKNKWVSEDHQQRAVLLTQYLVTGEQVYPEFDLLLNKILVGYPLENSLPSDILLSDFEIQEATDVLRSVINHWKVLKNTSAVGLQTTFFQREGKLVYSDARWLLQVEQKTMDILLGKLSWGISIIKFPWMESRLHVEWT